MRLVALLVLVASVPAAAAPCSVTVARAPDGVREVVDHWVSAEPRCTAALDVRIVETEGGLYVIARDDHGRVRDRVVPDAQTAGVLIASWAADDSVSLAVPPAPTPVIVAATPLTADELRVEAQVDEQQLTRPRERRWVRLGLVEGLDAAMLSSDDNEGQPLVLRGLRGSTGIWTHGPWTLDVAFDLVDSRPEIIGRPPGYIAVREYSAFASLGYVLRSRTVSLTPSAGLGLRYGILDYETGMPVESMSFHHQGAMAIAQTSVLGALDLTPRFQLTLGMSAVFHPDPWQIRENLELVWIGGVGVAM